MQIKLFAALGLSALLAVAGCGKKEQPAPIPAPAAAPAPANGAIVVYDPDRFHILLAHFVFRMARIEARLKPALQADSA